MSTAATPAGPRRPAGGPSDQAPSGAVVRTLPAFPYPPRPQYTGTGDVNQAQNYVPVLPATPTQDDIDWIEGPDRWLCSVTDRARLVRSRSLIDRFGGLGSCLSGDLDLPLGELGIVTFTTAFGA